MFEYIHTLVHRSRVALANGLMNLILRLHGEHVTCDSMEDTAEMSEDGRHMIINFVFCGTLRTIKIAFDRRRISSNIYIFRNKSGDEIGREVSSVPGIDSVVFSKLNLMGIYPELSEIESITDDDD